ncbi:hypothetical protein NQZ79_g1993 [Umbelopsis isabellina]|nr:hypothetical protein NQZ79_g1993 [Umbelopsis isabellina]
MTVTAYLCRLTLGSNALVDQQERNSSETAEENRHALELRSEVERSEAEVLATVGFYNAPDIKQEASENFAGFSLAVGAMVGNYVLCFPFVVARHRRQTIPSLFYRRKDSPIDTMDYLIRLQNREGWRALYPGFGLGLLAQGFAVTYESTLNMILSRTINKNTSSGSLVTQVAQLTVAKALELAVYIPLHPIYRSALIMRTQTQSSTTRRVITSYRGFWRSCKTEFYRFLNFRTVTKPNQLPLVSVFVPSCLLSIISEKLLTIIYKYLNRLISKSKSTEKRSNRRNQRRQRSSSLRHSFSRDMLETPTSSPAEDTALRDTKSKRPADETTLYSFYPEIVCGIASSMLTRAIVYPAETIVFRLMLQDSGVLLQDTSYTGFWDCLFTIVKEEGCWNGLYAGVGSWLAEVALGYVILESSWIALKLTKWRLQRKHDREVEKEWRSRKATIRNEN